MSKPHSELEVDIREHLRNALELANFHPEHSNGHAGGTFRRISDALENIEPGSVEYWSNCGEWPS